MNSRPSGFAARLHWSPLFEPVVEQEPVGEAGEGVVQRLAAQLLFGETALRDLVLEALVGLQELGGAFPHAALEQLVGLPQLLLHAQAVEELGHRRRPRRRHRGGEEATLGVVAVLAWPGRARCSSIRDGGAMMNRQQRPPEAMHSISADTSGMPKLSAHQPEE